MSSSLGLFEAYGIELEYMIVDRSTLRVLPICDQVIKTLSGKIKNEISMGEINISNELVLHVIEFKSNGPKKDLVKLASDFQYQINSVNQLLEATWNAQLLPTAMHPLMSPQKETRLWPHGQNTIYETYNRIFDCRGHGWSNLQSVHINLPFANDEQFGRLHAAIRIVLALLPGLAASSPIVEGNITGKLDNRLVFYSQNQRKIASIIGDIIPEKSFSKETYESIVFAPIKRDISPYDPDQVLEEEWLNSRGAIARFDRGAIEIRLLDIQESVPADFAIISLVVSLVQSLVDGLWISYEKQMTADEKVLKDIFLQCIESGGDTVIKNKFLLSTFAQKEPLTVNELWQRILVKLKNNDYPVKNFSETIELILKRDTLAKSIQTTLGHAPSEAEIVETFKELAKCLSEGSIYGV